MGRILYRTIEMRHEIFPVYRFIEINSRGGQGGRGHIESHDGIFVGFASGYSFWPLYGEWHSYASFKHLPFVSTKWIIPGCCLWRWATIVAIEKYESISFLFQLPYAAHYASNGIVEG